MSKTSHSIPLQSLTPLYAKFLGLIFFSFLLSGVITEEAIRDTGYMPATVPDRIWVRFPSQRNEIFQNLISLLW